MALGLALVGARPSESLNDLSICRRPQSLPVLGLSLSVASGCRGRLVNPETAGGAHEPDPPRAPPVGFRKIVELCPCRRPRSHNGCSSYSAAMPSRPWSRKAKSRIVIWWAFIPCSPFAELGPVEKRVISPAESKWYRLDFTSLF